MNSPIEAKHNIEVDFLKTLSKDKDLRLPGDKDSIDRITDFVTFFE